MSDSHHEEHGHGGGHEQAEEEGHGHERHWGDYNAQPLKPSSLPTISGPALAVFALALVAMLGAITYYSFVLGGPKAEVHTHHEE